jgi:hypothetical protein
MSRRKELDLTSSTELLSETIQELKNNKNKRKKKNSRKNKTNTIGSKKPKEMNSR